MFLSEITTHGIAEEPKIVLKLVLQGLKTKVTYPMKNCIHFFHHILQNLSLLNHTVFFSHFIGTEQSIIKKNQTLLKVLLHLSEHVK